MLIGLSAFAMKVCCYHTPMHCPMQGLGSSSVASRSDILCSLGTPVSKGSACSAATVQALCSPAASPVRQHVPDTVVSTTETHSTGNLLVAPLVASRSTKASKVLQPKAQVSMHSLNLQLLPDIVSVHAYNIFPLSQLPFSCRNAASVFECIM